MALVKLIIQMKIHLLLFILPTLQDIKRVEDKEETPRELNMPYGFGPQY